MSLYNMLHGVQPTVFFVLPMLGKHPDEYPRFRDCFVGMEDKPEYDNHIIVYTRTGGGNREEYKKDNAKMSKSKYYVADLDDNEDSTYALWIFSVPKEWKADFKLIKAGKLPEVSTAYQQQVHKVFPKLKEKLDSIWKKEDASTTGENNVPKKTIS